MTTPGQEIDMGKHKKKSTNGVPDRQLVVTPGSTDGAIKFRTVDNKDLEIRPDGICRLSGAGHRGGQNIVLDDEMKQVVIDALQGKVTLSPPVPTEVDVRSAVDGDGRPIIEDRPAGPNDTVLESGLISGRWYDGAPQDCENRCHGLPEGQHVPPCPLNTSERPPVEEPDESTSETAAISDG